MTSISTRFGQHRKLAIFRAKNKATWSLFDQVAFVVANETINSSVGIESDVADKPLCIAHAVPRVPQHGLPA